MTMHRNAIRACTGGLLLLAACGEPTRGAAALQASLESIGNEMMTMHEPHRVVEYHDTSAGPYWVAFIPPQVDARTVAESGIAIEPSCRTSGRTSVVVGVDDRHECITLAPAALANLLVIHKQAGETTKMTVALDAGGYRVIGLE